MISYLNFINDLLVKNWKLGFDCVHLTQVWYFTNHGFKAKYFEKYDYNCNYLGAPSMWFRLGRVIPLDGATSMDRPPLGGEGKQWDVNSLIEKYFTFCFESREKSYLLDEATTKRNATLSRKVLSMRSS